MRHVCLPCATTQLARSPLKAQRRPKGCLGRSRVTQRTFRFRHGRREVLSISKQSHKGRRRGQSLTDRSNEAGGRRTYHRVVVEWMQNGVGHWSPHKNAYHCKHCVSIWTMLVSSFYHHYASFGRPIASIERSLWWPLCLHSATTSNLEPPWQSFCLHSASLVQSVVRLLQFWWVKEGTRVVLQQLHRNRTFLVWATTEHPDHLSGCSKVARRSQHCVKGT